MFQMLFVTLLTFMVYLLLDFLFNVIINVKILKLHVIFYYFSTFQKNHYDPTDLKKTYYDAMNDGYTE